MDVKVYDLVVVGSGAAGLSAAVTAAHRGLKVAVLEKDETLGGATAWSGGWMWVPRNFHARAAGIVESLPTVRSYLMAELGDRFDPNRVDAFLKAAPEMAEFFHQHTRLQFDHGNGIADIHHQSPGAGEGGRSLIARPYNGRLLGNQASRIRPTMRETSLWGMPIQAGADLWAFLNATRSVKSAGYVMGRLTRHAMDWLRSGRSWQWRNGIALVGRLVHSAMDLKVDFYTSAQAEKLVCSERGVSGVIAATRDGELEFRARSGVLLACGGFAHDVQRRQALFKRTPTGREHWPLPPPSVSGDGLSLGESVGAAIDCNQYSAAAWAPVSLVPYRDGKVGHFPHIVDRAKPGVIGVLADGQRFVNEADGYFDYVDAMIQRVPVDEEVASWLICDHRCQRRYGLGISRPFPMPLRYWIQSGYLRRGNTLEELAQACGIDVAGLVRTVNDYNRDARLGNDTQYGRGESPYNRKNGDPSHRPNPCVATIEQGPYYAVKVVPGSFGTFAGLMTNERAQVLREDGSVITRLYAGGCDMASIMGGYYPAGGINLGPAMTFGYITGQQVAQCAEESEQQQLKGAAHEND